MEISNLNDLSASFWIKQIYLCELLIQKFGLMNYFEFMYSQFCCNKKNTVIFITKSAVPIQQIKYIV